MELNHLYTIAENENIPIYNRTLKDCEGMYCSDNNIKAIVLDYSQLNNTTDEKCVLAEELGHYYCNATYPISCTDKTLIDKAEYRAKKWAVKTLISPSDLRKAKLLGLKYKWELADFFGVTECIAEKALDFVID